MEEGTPILVVEDDARVRRELVSIVKEFGPVTEATTRSEAEQLLAGGSFEMVLVDLGLPDGSGLDLFESLKNLGVSPAVVIVSSTLNIVARNQCLAQGAADFISKPFHPAELSRRLHRAMASHNRAHQRDAENIESIFPEASLTRLSPRERAVLATLATRPLVPVSLNDLAVTVDVPGILVGVRLRRIIRRLRRVLEDDPQNPKVIVEIDANADSAVSRIMFIPPQKR